MISSGTESSQADAGARRILEARAAALARVADVGRREGELSFLTFAVGFETYAIESRFVIHVFPLRELARLPGAEPPLFGVTPWRGDLLTLIDLRQALGTTGRRLPDLGRVLVLGEKRAAFGVLADTVDELIALHPDDVHPLPERDGDRGLIRGITDGAMLVLDGQELLRIHG